MSDKTKHILRKNYKVLLLQLATRLIEKVNDTGLKTGSKRSDLTLQLATISKDLEREFKRDTTLEQAAEAKKDLFDDLYSGDMPDWLLGVLFTSLTEESHKLTKRSA